MTDVVKILRAFRPGDVVFIESDRVLSMEAMENLRKNIDTYLKDTGIKIVVLGGNLRIAAREEILSDESVPN